MTVWWLSLPLHAVPASTAWLGPRELETLKGLSVEKRRADWLLGRYVVKYALAHLQGIDRLQAIDVVASNGGAPEAFVGARRLSHRVSISHREGMGACAVTDGPRVGCDLEMIEPRTSRFVADYFTPTEQAVVEETPEEQRPRVIALTWSAKESALKVLGVGLRRDTRKVHVAFPSSARAQGGWHPIEARVEPEGETLRGWWRAVGRLVLTVLSAGPRAATPLRVLEAPSGQPIGARSAPETGNS